MNIAESGYGERAQDYQAVSVQMRRVPSDRVARSKDKKTWNLGSEMLLSSWVRRGDRAAQPRPTPHSAPPPLHAPDAQRTGLECTALRATCMYYMLQLQRAQLYRQSEHLQLHRRGPIVLLVVSVY